jgi:hypothetical protein
MAASEAAASKANTATAAALKANTAVNTTFNIQPSNHCGTFLCYAANNTNKIDYKTNTWSQ